MLLNVSPEELIVLKAAMDIALQAASGYSVRTHQGRDTISAHWKDFTRLNGRISILESQRELDMTSSGGKLGRDKKYLHVGLHEGVHDRLYRFVLQRGGGKIRTGSIGEIVDAALTEYLDRHAVVLNEGTAPRQVYDSRVKDLVGEK
jgi:hypothetical protein